MKIQPSDHFTYGQLLRFAPPSITMMRFTSVYSVALPLLFGLDGIWYALFVAEILSMAVTGYYYRINQSVYR